MTTSLLEHIVPKISSKRLEYVKYGNLLYNLQERRYRHISLKSLPIELTIDTTTICQLSCPHCCTGKKTIQRAGQVMRPDDHLSYISALADSCFLAWYFSNGEPLLNKHLPKIIKQNSQKEIFSIISTNLSIELSEKKILELLQSGLNVISISLDGASEATYQQYRRGGNFNLVVKNMKRLITIKNALGLKYPLILWRFLLFKHNAEDIPMVLLNAKNWGIDLLELYPGGAPLSSENPDTVLAFDGEFPSNNYTSPLLEELTQREDTFFRKHLASNQKNDEFSYTPSSTVKGKCDWLYFSSMMYPDGDIGPCCVTGDEKDDFGNIHNKSFKDIWNNEKYQGARMYLQGLNTEHSLICKKCPVTRSQKYQFMNSLRTYLLNAPEWFLKIIASDPDRFIDPIDIELSPHIFSAFFSDTVTSRLGVYSSDQLEKILLSIENNIQKETFDHEQLAEVL
jgi:radical SAM protein with 4Fe4S-binding SPASM domain